VTPRAPLSRRSSSNSYIQGVGIDLVELSRAKRFVRLHQDRLKNFFTPSEYRLFLHSKSKAKSFALLFAAKEAASKSLGITLTHPGAFRQFRVSWQDHQLCVGLTGVNPSGKAQKIKLIPFSLKHSLGVIALAYHNMLY